MIRGEIRKMNQESRANVLAVRMEREQLHPAGIDADQRLVRARGQAGNRPVMPLGLARYRDAVAAVAPENLQDLFRLWLSEQLLEARDVFEAQFRGFRALVGVAQDRPALHPVALLLEIQELSKTG